MITFDTFLIYMIPVIILSLSPGPGMMYVAGRALAQGRTMGLISVLGLEFGAFLHVIAAALGLSALIIANHNLLIFIQIIGAFYLLHLARLEMHAKKIITQNKPAQIQTYSLGKVLRQGIFTSLVNPKITLFIFAFLPTFIDTSKNVPLQFLTLGLIFNCSGVIVNSGVVLLVSALGQSRFLSGNSSTHYKHWLVSGLFVCLGLATLYAAGREIVALYL
jgi:threonine/homoserine/homoserine lactone efflux protein